jgi:hypothetical protein
MHLPISLILKVLQKLEREGGTGILVVPDWKGQVWSPIVRPLSVQKIVLGDAEQLFEKEAQIKKKELYLLLREIDTYLLKNPPIISQFLLSQCYIVKMTFWMCHVVTENLNLRAYY